VASGQLHKLDEPGSTPGPAIEKKRDGDGQDLGQAMEIFSTILRVTRFCRRSYNRVVRGSLWPAKY
jgi:hypothetical protein